MKQTNYDAIVVGGGIAGLTAATYVAKAGAKAILIERREKVGGYCGSFKRDGYIFDEAVHYINNYGESGLLRRICRDLNVEGLIQVLRIDPSDRLLMPNKEIVIYTDSDRTLEGLKALFPKQANALDRFFGLVQNFHFNTIYVQWHGKSFRELLDAYFSEEELKTALSVFSSTLGLNSEGLSAVAGLAYYKGSILDGGYHVVGGAQKLADALLARYLEYGGEVLLEAQVKEILLNNRRIHGIKLSDGTQVRGKTIIAACDATQVFTEMLQDGRPTTTFGERITSMSPSLSNFIVYLGIKGRLNKEVPKCCNLWYFPFTREAQGSVDITEDNNEVGFVHIALSSLHDRSLAPPDGETLVLFTGARYLSKEYWEKNRNRLTDVLIKRAEKIMPDLKSRIAVMLPATPQTLYRYTLNRGGAYRGWALTAEQTRWDILPSRTHFSGLFLAGHWVTTPVGNGGVSMAAISGRNTARSVLRVLMPRTT